MEESNMNSAIPEISTDTSSEISNQSIYQSRENNKERIDGLTYRQNEIDYK